MKKIKQIVFLMAFLLPAIVFGQCPQGAIDATNSTGSINVLNGQTYCASTDISIADLTVQYGGKFIVAAGTTIQASGSFNIQGDLIVEDGASIMLNGSMGIGFAGNQPALVQIGKGSYISVRGSLSQYDATMNGYYSDVKNLIQMNDNSVMEICGTYSFDSKQYNAIDFIGTNQADAYFITKAQVSGATSSVLTNFNQIHWIAMHSVSDISPGQASYCGQYATPNSCNVWPQGLTNDTNDCFRAGIIVDELLPPLPSEELNEAPCNEYTNWIEADYSNLTVRSRQSRVWPFPSVDDFSNKERLIDNNLNNYASWTAMINGHTWIEVKDNNAVGDAAYPAGSYAGFVINDTDILALGGSMKIKTYLGDTEQEVYNAVDFISSFLGGGKKRFGFVTSKAFDRVRLQIDTGLTLISNINVYYAQILKPCEDPDIECNEPVALTQANRDNQENGYPVVVETARSGLGSGTLGTFVDANHVVDSNPDTYMNMEVNAGVAGSASISVRKLGEELPAGYFAGFNISNAQILGLEFFNNLQIRTYLDGQLQESSTTSTSLMELPFLASSNRHTVGFVTTEPFNEIRLTINQSGVNLGTTRVYHAVTKKYCIGDALDCNTNTALTSPDYPIDLSLSKTGVSGVGCAACEVKNPGHLIDPDPDKYARINLPGGVGASGRIGVKNGIESYPAGTYAGFEISSDELISLSLLNNFQIKTFLEGVPQETATGATLFLAGDLLSSTDRQVMGFVTNQDFDELQFIATNGAGINLGVIRVYAPIVKEYCEGPELECNVETTVTSPEFPIDLNYVRTGIEGVACLACGLNNPQNILDGNENTFASIILPASVANSAGISVRNGYETYPQNTYVAFEVSNTNLINFELLGGTTIELYKNNQLVQSGTGDAQLFAANSTITGGVNKGLIGMVSNVEFDEARFVIRNFGNVNVGTTNIYKMVITKGCEGEFDCQTSTSLTSPDYSVVIESSRTGIGSGLACTGCSVNAPWKVLNNDLNDPATINLVAGVAGTSGSISVRDLSLEYPTGTIAGFVIQDPNPVLEAGLLSAITIHTYLNGVHQETKLGTGQLIDFNFILPWLGSGSGKRAIGFVTSKPFNEIRITYTSLAQALDFLNVYYAFADGRFAIGNGFDCNELVPIHVVNDINQTPENTPVDGNVLTNDFGNGLMVKEAVYLDENGNEQDLILGTPTPIYDENGDLAGEITLNSDGTYTFIPETGYVGKVPVRYTAEDEHGFTDEGKLTIKVIPVINPNKNNPPIAQDDYYLVNKNTPINGNVLGNDSDPDGDDLTVTNIHINGVDYPVTPGTPTVVTTPEGEITINSDGSFTFVPEDGYTGKVPPITYTVTDGEEEDTADINIKVIDTPEGKNTTYAVDDAKVAPKGTAMSGNVLDNDYDPEGDNQMVTVATARINGTDYLLTFGSGTVIPSVGEIIVNNDGSYDFTPEADFVGTLEVNYQIKDENNNNRSDYDEEATSSAVLYLTSLDTIAGGYVSAKVLLQGALVDPIQPSQFVSDDLMRDDLRDKGLLPTTQPYGDLYDYQGGEEVTDMRVFDDKNEESVVDWVLLELRDPNDPTVIVSRRAALVLRNGNVVDVDGVSPVFFEAYAGDYYLAVRHRNHLGVMSNSVLDLRAPANFDFRVESLYERSDRSEAAAFSHSNYQILWAGDTNNDRVVKYSSANNDVSVINGYILAHPNNLLGGLGYSWQGYSVFDVNMDGVVRSVSGGNDPALIRVNITSNSLGNLLNGLNYSLFYDNLP